MTDPVDRSALSALLIELGGEVDLRNAQALDDALCEAIDRTHAELVVDLSTVSFIDSSGIRMMINVHEHATAQNSGVRWRGLQPAPARLVAAAGLDYLLHIDQELDYGTSSYEGDVEIRRVSEWIVTASATIRDLDDAGWLGQITSRWSSERFPAGSVIVEVLGGSREGWSARAYVDAAGVLQGEAGFRPEPIYSNTSIDTAADLHGIGCGAQRPESQLRARGGEVLDVIERATAPPDIEASLRLREGRSLRQETSTDLPATNGASPRRVPAVST